MKINPLSILVINNNNKVETLQILNRLEGLEYPSVSLILMESDAFTNESVRGDLQDVTLPCQVISIDRVDNLAACLRLSLPVARANGSEWMLVVGESIEIDRNRLLGLSRQIWRLRDASIVFSGNQVNNQVQKITQIGGELKYHYSASFFIRVLPWEPEKLLETGWYRFFEISDLSIKGRKISLFPYVAWMGKKKVIKQVTQREWYYLGRNMVLVWRLHKVNGRFGLGMMVGYLWLKFNLEMILFSNKKERNHFYSGMSDGWHMDLFEI